MIVKSKWSLAAAALAFAVTAAHAGALVVGQKLEIDVDPKNVAGDSAKIWEQFGGFCAIKDWHPALSNCEESKEGDVTFRTLTLKDGGKIKEKLTEKKDLGYKYEIVESPLPVKNYTAQFTITPDDDDEDEVNLVWTSTFDANGKPDKEAKDVIEGIFKGGLDSIKAKLKK